MKKLRLVLQCQSLCVGKGGAEKIATELAAEMASHGHIVYIGFKKKGDPAYPQGKDVKLLPYSSLRSFSGEVSAIDPDVFFTFYVDHSLIHNFAIVDGKNIPVGIQECSNPFRICNNNWRKKIKGQYFSAWEREIIASGAARIRLTMPSYKLSFADYIQPQVRCFANPAYPQTCLSDPVGASAARKKIININGFKSNKNLIALIQAFGQLAKEFPEWDLEVVGKHPDRNSYHVEEIFDCIDKNDLKDRIKILGPRDNLYSHYSSAQVHVISSLEEGCPTVVLEAMSVGLPSIGYADCLGTNELIRHNVNGILADPNDRISGLTIALQKMMSADDARYRFGRQALEDSKAFDPKLIYDQWEQLFYEAAAYKDDPDRLFKEQFAINPEKALHARRMREKILKKVRI